MYAGVEINSDRTLTVTLMDKNRNITYIGYFWKEGFYWFLDHFNIKILTFNLSFKDKKYFEQRFKVYLDLKSILETEFDFVYFPDKLDLKEGYYCLTDADKFFERSVKKELMPIYTREGLEQRIYNLPKSGIYLPHYMLSKDRKKLKSEVNATVAAFTSFSVDNNLFSVERDNDEEIVVPVYRFVPKGKRVISSQLR